MYYLLAYRLFGKGYDRAREYINTQDNGNGDETDKSRGKAGSKKEYIPTWLERAKLKQNKRKHFGKSSIFDTMEESIIQEVRHVLCYLFSSECYPEALVVCVFN